MLFSEFSDIQATWLDYPDTTNIAIEIFMIGCRHNCPSCSNPKLQSVDTPTKTFEELYGKIQKALDKYRTNKIVLVGGEPLLQENNNHIFVKQLLEKDHEVIIYTGYSMKYVKNLNLIGFTFLKCGKYIEKLKQESFKTEELMQFASSNQKLYDNNFNLLSTNGQYYFKEQQ